MPNNDPFRWTDVLEKIDDSSVAKTLREGDASNDSDSAVAYLWTETIGKCRLFGVDVEERYQINFQVASLALSCGMSFVKDSIRDLEEIEDDIATSETQLEIDEHVCSPLEERMDYWAVTIAAEAAIRESHDSDAREALLAFIDLVEKFDKGLEEKIDDICLAAQTNLLSNWTDSLDSKYAEPGPWWLDGCLEEQLRQLDRVASPLRCGISMMERAFDSVSNDKETEATYSMAASSPRRRRTRGTMRWSQPDQTVNAELHKLAPLRSEGKTKARLEFTEGQIDPARHLKGKKVEFGDCEAAIEETAVGTVVATFIYEDLQQQAGAGKSDLIVDGVPWVFLGYFS